MSGFFSFSDPIVTERSTRLIPQDLIRCQHWTRDAGSHVMKAAILGTHRDDAAIAAAEAAAHDPLDRNLAAASVASGRSRRCREHTLGPACVHDRRPIERLR